MTQARTIQPAHDDALRAWDWQAAAAAADRSLAWLARHTDRSDMQVYRYARGEQTPPVSWLLAAARALGVTLVGERGPERFIPSIES